MEAAESLNALLGIMNMALVVLGVFLAIGAGTMLATKASVDPSGDMLDVDARSIHYFMTQERLRHNRAARRARTNPNEVNTRGVNVGAGADVTQPDLSVADMFWQERVGRATPETRGLMPAPSIVVLPRTQVVV